MISLLIINYRSAALAAEAIRSARETTSAPLQVVVVDNSLDEAEALRTVADVVIAPATNLGYAGGINLGRRSCEAETIVVSNPDVIFREGAIDRLSAALDEKTAVAGPALYWDHACEWILPPADLNTTAEKFDEVLASRSKNWFKERDRRRIHQRQKFWALKKTTHVRGLSGAVMAIQASEFDAVGGFDERFRLYFEEIDFLRRVTRRIVYVPDAKCRHLYNQSAGQDSAAAGSLYARSEHLYLEKWSGPIATQILEHLERAPHAGEPRRVEGPIPVDRENVVIEVSPLPTFATAAGHFPRTNVVELPPEIRQSVRDQPLYFRIVDTIVP
jgi:N-acetylglucosaminyl-diphospho-decaprenol L-rhamnosyltransferase